MNKSSAIVYVGDTVQLKTNINSGVKWSSSNSKIAVVTSKGKVTAKRKGKVTITAKANGVAARCIITVKSVNEKSFIISFVKSRMRESRTSGFWCAMQGTQEMKAGPSTGIEQANLSNHSNAAVVKPMVVSD